MENPAKRPRTSLTMVAPGSGGGDNKEKLVARVKAFQKEGTEQKELWGCYADTYLGGMRDPSRHDASTLKEFCDNHGDPDVQGGMGGMGMTSPSKQLLVDKIKAFQRQSPDNKESWGAFCGATRDPARHDEAKLQEFVTAYAL